MTSSGPKRMNMKPGAVSAQPQGTFGGPTQSSLSGSMGWGRDSTIVTFPSGRAKQDPAKADDIRSMVGEGFNMWAVGLLLYNIAVREGWVSRLPQPAS